MGFLDGLVKLADGITDSWSTRTAINRYLEKYGEVTRLKIDRKNHAIDVELKLHGESSPVALGISSYQYEKPARPGEAGYIKLGGISASRQWIEEVARDHIEGRILKVPPDAAKYLGMLL